MSGQANELGVQSGDEERGLERKEKPVTEKKGKLPPEGTRYGRQ